MKFSHTYRLPNGLNGDLVLIQWHYFTSNSCIYTGYREYTWPVGWEVSETIPECQNIPHDGNGVPEQFWNCAEVTINTTGRSSSLPATTSATQAAGDIAAITTTIPVAESTTTTVTAKTISVGTSSVFFCGSTWYDAAMRCSKQCPGGVDSECGSGERCYADTLCSTTSSISSRCGQTWYDARDHCGSICTTTDDCSEGYYCFAGIQCNHIDILHRKNLRG